MRRIITVLALMPLPALADATMGGKTVDCYCTDKSGARIEMGETVCLQVDGRMFMAQCQMSQNVPMWRKVTDGCLSSGLPQSLKPQTDPRTVDAHI
jgi:hypothetical protein